MNQLEKETIENIAAKVWDCDTKYDAKKMLLKEIKKLLANRV